MARVSSTLRSTDDGFAHWCPACAMMHGIRTRWGWTIGADLERPTIQPSLRQLLGGGAQCHYVMTNGTLHFQPDCTHALAGKSVPLPALPE